VPEDLDGRNAFEQAVQADMLVNTMIRIARDLERVLIALWVSGGILAAIGILVLIRTLIGR
jgi:hypothetical protein